MFSDFFKGINSYSKALGLISEMKLWGYLLLPGIIGLAIAAGIGFSAWGFYDDLGAIFTNWLPTGGEGWIGRLLERGSRFIAGFSNIVSGLLILVLGVILYKHLLIVFLSPFMSPLAQKVEEHLTGRKSPYSGFKLVQVFRDIIRGLRIAFRNIIREFFLSALLIILSFIPVVGAVSALLLFLVQANYAGFGNIDYTLERHYSVRQSVRFIRRNRGLALGNGTVFVLLISTGIGVFIAPTLATIAGTIEAVKRIEPNQKYSEDLQEFV